MINPLPICSTIPTEGAKWDIIVKQSKSKKSRYSVNEFAQPQSFQVTTVQQESHRLTTEYDISCRKEVSASKREQHEGQFNSGIEATLGMQ